MTTVVSDTSPINYLVLIGAIDVLPQLFEQVLLPPAVWKELQHQKTPKSVFDWAESLPAWVTIEKPLQIDHGIGLGTGENEAISLAVERHISAVLIDDRQGWLAAEARSLVPVGTINILESAALRNLVDFDAAITKLLNTNFRIHQNTIAGARARIRAHKQQN